VNFTYWVNVHLSVKTVVTVVYMAESRPAKIDLHRTSVDQPLHKTGLNSSVSKSHGHLLWHLARDLRRHVRNDIWLVVASFGKWCVGHRVRILTICAFVAEDAPNVSGVEVRAVALSSTCPHSKPVVADGSVRLDKNVIPLAYPSSVSANQMWDGR
jgi:hypothetical protein